MRAYLASGFGRRRALRIVRDLLIERGNTVTSTWIDLDERPEVGGPDWEEFAGKIAKTNVDDLLRADALFFDTGGISQPSNGGCFTEFGIALGVITARPLASLQAIIIGRRVSSFHYLPQVKQWDSWEQYFIDVHSMEVHHFDRILSEQGIYLGPVG